MQWKRLFIFLFLNIIVSALTTTLVLILWDRSHQSEATGLGGDEVVFTIPTITPVVQSPQPEALLQAYQVSEGETLGEIALAFNIPVEDLLALNGLTDPHSIGAGTTIFLPVPENENADSTPSQEATSTANTGQVEIVGVFGAGDLASERVQIRGLGQDSLSLTGWRLRDEGGNEYVFPQITLFGNGAVDVYSSAGVDTVVSLYWRSRQAVWSPGETATLIDEQGNFQATYTLP
jgi:LysM repeat protein